ncbi:MAG TPA: DM13 domain-containing protein [Solirubrobacteraceae bacterium]|jgi:hypothetical protein
MALTAGWFLVAAATCLVAVRGRRALRAPVLGGYAVAAVAVGAYLAYATVHDRVVHERVAAGPVEASATFVSGEHETVGTARVVRVSGGGRVVTLTGFATSAGPDLRVRLAPGTGTDGAAAGVVDLGALKGNRGDQQYDLPAGVDARRATVLIWCRAFSALFGSAALAPA